MAIKKIPCGGWLYDDEQITFEDGVMRVIGGGGSDPIVENAKETGGIGYTESGVETILVDNERVATVPNEGGLAVGQFVTPFDIVDGAYTVIFNGTEYNLNSAFFKKNWYLGDIPDEETGRLDFSRYPFVIGSESEETYLATESAGDYEVTIKTEPDTIHKIDEKYLPSEVFVINIDDDDWENKRTDPDFGLTVWKAFQSGQQIHIQRGEIARNTFKCSVVSTVSISHVSGGTEMLELQYIEGLIDYQPEGASTNYWMSYMDAITLPLVNNGDN